MARALIWEVAFYRYGYKQEPKDFATLEEVADWAYEGSVERTVYVEYATKITTGEVVRRHELLEMGEQRARRA